MKQWTFCLRRYLPTAIITSWYLPAAINTSWYLLRDIYFVIFATRYLLRDICYAIYTSRYLPSAILTSWYLLRDILPSAIATSCLSAFAFKKCFISHRMQRLFNFQFWFFKFVLLLMWFNFSLLYKPICRKANYVSLVFKISLQLSIINYQFLSCLLWFDFPLLISPTLFVIKP